MIIHRISSIHQYISLHLAKIVLNIFTEPTASKIIKQLRGLPAGVSGHVWSGLDDELDEEKHINLMSFTRAHLNSHQKYKNRKTTSLTLLKL